jgi:hypothetical protein
VGGRTSPVERDAGGHRAVRRVPRVGDRGLRVGAAARPRGRASSIQPGTSSRDATALAIGTIAWFAFGFWLHGPLIGVRPF